MFRGFLRKYELYQEILLWLQKKIWTHYDIICINAIYLVNNDQKIISKVRGAFLWFIGGSFLATRRWWWPPMHSVRFCQILAHFIILSYFCNYRNMIKFGVKIQNMNFISNQLTKLVKQIGQLGELSWIELLSHSCFKDNLIS